MFSKIGILKNFANFKGKHLCWSFFLIKLQALRPATSLKTDSNTRIFFYEICEQIVSPLLLQELINDLAVCKHCSGTILLVEDVISSHGFGNYNYILQNGATLFHRST